MFLSKCYYKLSSYFAKNIEYGRTQKCKLLTTCVIFSQTLNAIQPWWLSGIMNSKFQLTDHGGSNPA